MIFVLLSYLLLQTAIAVAQPPLPPREILNRAFDHEDAMKAAREHYVYSEHAERREATAAGSPGKLNYTQDYEWSVVGGGPFRKLVRINEHPVEGKKARDEDKRMEIPSSERQALERANPKRYGICFPCVDNLDIVSLLQQTLVREDSVNGRPAWVVVSQLPRGVPPDPHQPAATFFKITHWIDEQDFAIARVRFEQVRMGGPLLPGSWHDETRVRLSDGVWFLQKIDREGHTTPNHWWFQKHTFSNIRKFGAESTILFVEKDEH